MNTKGELDRIIGDWLEDRVAEPSRAGLDAVLDRMATTPQHRRRWLDRLTGSGRGASRRTGEHGRRSDRADGRRDKIVITATGLVAAVGAITLGVALVLRAERDGSSLAPAAGMGVTHVVAQDGSGDFATIGEAIAAAVAGDTIRVAPGEYIEALVIDKDITLIGDGPAGAVVIGIPSDAPRERAEEWLRSDARMGIRLTRADAALSDLSLAGGADAISVLVDGGFPTLSDLQVTVPPPTKETDEGRAFHLIGGSTATLTGSTFDGYLAVRDGAAPAIEDNVILTGAHLSIDGPGETIVRDNTFANGTGTSLSADARGLVEGNDLTDASIVVDSGSDIVVRGNTLRDVVADGVRPAILVIGSGSSATVSGNTVTGSTIGIAVQEGATGTISDNVLTDNGIGVSATSPHVLVEGNSIRGSRTAVVVGSGTVTGNTIEGNEAGLSTMRGSGRPTITGNTLCDNGVDVRPSAGGPVSLDGNQVCDPNESGPRA